MKKYVMAFAAAGMLGAMLPNTAAQTHGMQSFTLRITLPGTCVLSEVGVEPWKAQ